MRSISTIGYEATSVPHFLETLQEAKIELLVDIRAISSSRRPGFSKTRLAANLQSVGIDYLHLRDLGTPAEGRAASRAHHYDELRKIYLQHLATPQAQEELEILAELVQSGRRVCLLCLEADPVHCHRSMVAAALAERMPLKVNHLAPEPGA